MVSDGNRRQFIASTHFVFYPFRTHVFRTLGVSNPDFNPKALILTLTPNPNTNTNRNS